MGDMGPLQSDYSAQTHGLFGFHEGAQSFGFETNGTAFIGKSGAGRIYFDGNGGVISSAKYNGNTDYKSGTKIDLQSGSLIMEGVSGQYFKFNENGSGRLEMKINGADIKLSDNEDDTLTGYISATAEGITSEFRKTANYIGTCSTADGINPKIITCEGVPTSISAGFSISITFTGANTKTTSGLQFTIGGINYNVLNSPKWEAGETLSFIYNGTNFIMDSLSSSKIE
jgi:hypothetical protein